MTTHKQIFFIIFWSYLINKSPSANPHEELLLLNVQQNRDLNEFVVKRNTSSYTASLPGRVICHWANVINLISHIFTIVMSYSLTDYLTILDKTNMELINIDLTFSATRNLTLIFGNIACVVSNLTILAFFLDKRKFNTNN